jgi:hypothetical protein
MGDVPLMGAVKLATEWEPTVVAIDYLRPSAKVWSWHRENTGSALPESVIVMSM